MPQVLNLLHGACRPNHRHISLAVRFPDHERLPLHGVEYHVLPVVLPNGHLGGHDVGAVILVFERSVLDVVLQDVHVGGATATLQIDAGGLLEALVVSAEVAAVAADLKELLAADVTDVGGVAGNVGI